METNQTENQKNQETGEFNKFLISPFGQIIAIIVLVTFLMIPATQIGSLIRERQYRQHQVANELKKEWGPEFEYYGLVLEVPKLKKENEVFYIYPESSDDLLDVSVNEKYRGIFKANIFTSHLQSHVKFQLEKVRKLPINEYLYWSRARIMLVTGRNNRFKDFSKFKNGEQKIEVAGQYTKGKKQFCYSTNFPISEEDGNIEISFQAEVNGTEQVIYRPLASKSTLKLKTNWQDLSFSGNSLPISNSFKSEGEHLTASWKNLSQIGNHPHTTYNYIDFSSCSSSEIKFITFLDQYQLNERTVKYAILVLTLTFGVFFVIQIIGRMKMHPVHYLMIGLALLLFYSLLLSLSEHLGFNLAYIVASLTIVLLVVWYAKAILSSLKFAVMSGVSLSLLYGFLLVLVNLEVFALLVGSIGLLFVLAAVMSVTKRLKLD